MSDTNTAQKELSRQGSDIETQVEVLKGEGEGLEQELGKMSDIQSGRGKLDSGQRSAGLLVLKDIASLSKKTSEIDKKLGELIKRQDELHTKSDLLSSRSDQLQKDSLLLSNQLMDLNTKTNQLHEQMRLLTMNAYEYVKTQSSNLKSNYEEIVGGIDGQDDRQKRLNRLESQLQHFTELKSTFEVCYLAHAKRKSN